MSSLLDLVTGALDSKALAGLSEQIGAAPHQTAGAVQAALPLLLGALQRNAASPPGATALAGALDRDHDGSILDDVAGFFGQAASGSDLRSLDHIFGDRRSHVENALSNASGLGGPQVMQLLAQLAPLVLAALSRARAATPARGGTTTSGGLGDLLGGAIGQMQSSNAGIGGLLGGLLDSNGDGSGVDDLLKKGLSGSGGLGDLLGGLLGGKKP